MKNRYEALIVLNTKGGDDSIKESIERLEGIFKGEGAVIEGVQKMDRRQFSYNAGKLDYGFFVNFIFEAEPETLAKLRPKFKLDGEVYRQNYKKLGQKAAA